MIKGVKAGELSEDILDEWYRNAICVIFPSHYEGFGIPIIKGISYNKRTYCRKSPLADELIERIATPWHLSQYETTHQLVLQLKEDLHKIKSGDLHRNMTPKLEKCITWTDSVKEIENFLLSILRSKKSNSLRRFNFFSSLLSYQKKEP